MKIVVVIAIAILVTSCTAFSIASGIIGAASTIKTTTEINKLEKEIEELKRDR